METVGDYLKKERESKDISLSEVSRLTKISRFYLDFIEKDEFEKLPQGPYIKGYISSYSRFIGSDVDEALKLYDSLNQPPNQITGIDPEVAHAMSQAAAPVPLKPQGWRRPIALLGGKIVASMTAISSRVKAKRTTPKTTPKMLLKIAAAGNRMGEPLKKTGQAAIATLKAIRPKTRLYAGLAMMVACFLALTGVGLDRLFLHDDHQTAVARERTLTDPAPLPHRAADGGATITASGPDDPVPESEAKGVGRPEQVASFSDARPVERHPPPPAPLAQSDATAVAKTSSEEKSGPTAQPADRVVTATTGSFSEEGDAIARETIPGKPNAAPAEQARGDTAPPAPATAPANLIVLKASSCAAIENRMPAGVATSFPASIQRVYVWNQIEARQYPSKIHHIYYFKGRLISKVTLNVRSANWRTWSYKSFADDRYRGQWRVDITTDSGKLLRRLYLEIK